MKKVYSSKKIADLVRLSDSYLVLKYNSDFSENDIVPGQFVSIDAGSEFFVKRPFSIFDVSENMVSLFIKKVGKATSKLFSLKSGTMINILEVLGKGFTIVNGKKVALVGGGIGIAPLFFLARKLRRENNSVDVYYGVRNKEEMFFVNNFEKLGCTLYPSTDDGSSGFKGTSFDLFSKENKRYDFVYSCGPKQLLKSVSAHCLTKSIPCEISVEEVMGCGFGVCLGCAVKTKDGYKMACKDGPVFNAEEVVL